MKKPGLATMVMIGMAAGIGAGALFTGNMTFISFIEPVGTMFVRMFKMIMIPIVVTSLVVGVAGSGDAKRFGRLGFKTILYFEILTTIAIVLGLAIANIVKPGSGVDTGMANSAVAHSFEASAKAHSFVDTLVSIVPTNIIDSLAKADMLAVIFFSVMFGLGLGAIGEKGEPLLQVFRLLAEVMFKVTHMVMQFAPIGVFAMIGLTVARFGVMSLLPLLKLTVTVYAAMFIFVFLVLGGVAKWLGIAIVPLLRSVKEELLLAFSTSSSETVLPNMIEKSQKCGVPGYVASFVIPTGYTFNLDGSTLYQAIAALFIAQMYGIQLTIFHQITLVLTLMLTSKGIAGVPGASMVVLTATLGAVGIPVEGLTIILGVDRILDMARTVVNVVGNYVATIAVAKSEGAFDLKMARDFLGMPEKPEGAK